MGRISRLIVAGCVVASLLGACSSKGPGKVTTNRVLSKSEYIANADAICRSYQGRINSVVGNAGSGLSLEQDKKVFNDKLIPLFRGELAQLRSLRPPTADQVRIATMLIYLSQTINTIVGKVGGANSVADLTAIHPTGLPRFQKAAAAYGMKIC